MDARTTAAIAAFGLASAVGVGAVTLTAVSGQEAAADQGENSVSSQISPAPEVIYVDAPGTTTTTPAGEVVIEYVDVAAPATGQAAEYEDHEDHDEEYEDEYEEHEEHEDDHEDERYEADDD